MRYSKELGLLLIFGILLIQSGFSQTETKSKSQESKNKARVAPLAEMEESESQQKSELDFLDAYNSQRESFSPSTNKNLSVEEQSQLDFSLQSMEEAIPNSFSHNYATYVNGNQDVNLISNLEAAYVMEPDNPITYDDFVAYGELTDKTTYKKEFSQKLKDAEVYSKSEMEYNFNVLQSVESESYLITNGNVDTYPLWIYQETEGLEPGVQVVNIDLLQNVEYRNRILKELGINKKPLNENDIYSTVDLILTESKTKNVYLALTVSPQLIKRHSSSLWLTGLALKYDPTASTDNLSLLDEKWQKEFKQNHLESNEAINRNYILMWAQLKDYYANLGKNREVKKLEKLMENVLPSNRDNHRNPASY